MVIKDISSYKDDFFALRAEQICIYFVTASVFILGGVYFLQNFLDLRPCELCLWQRYPYFAALFGAVLVPLHLEIIALYGQILAFAAGFVISLYHSGIERDLWDGFSSCSGSLKGLSGDDWAKAIENTPLVKCDEIPFDILGVSLSNMNAILSLILLGAATLWMMNYRKSL